MSFKDKISKENLPKHVAVIMDGNGRWAKKRGNQRIFGHKHGVKSARAVTEAAAEIGIDYLTLYAFSTENWKRPRTEIDALMTLLVSSINSEVKTLVENNVRLHAIGEISSLSPKVQSKIAMAIDKTKDCTGLNLVIAISYSSKWEITDAIKNIGRQIKDGALNIDDITSDLISSNLTTKNFPDPELLIRTSGEFRISNFLLWQIAYSELYFTDVLWPDFNKEEFYKAIYEFQHRERRFGKTSEQVDKVE